MSRKYAILLDAGFVKRKIGTRSRPALTEDFVTFTNRLQSCERLVGLTLHRIYFYDAKPFDDAVERPLAGGPIDYSTTPIASRSKKLHSDLCRAAFYALRFGELDHNGWTVRKRTLDSGDSEVTISSEDLVPVIRQKGVDIRIGLDIATLRSKTKSML